MVLEMALDSLFLGILDNWQLVKQWVTIVLMKLLIDEDALMA